MPAITAATGMLDQESWFDRYEPQCPQWHGLDRPTGTGLSHLWLTKTARFVLDVYRKEACFDRDPSQAFAIKIPVCHLISQWGLPSRPDNYCVSAAVVRAVVSARWRMRPGSTVRPESNSVFAWEAVPVGENDAEPARGAYAPDLHAWIDSRDLLETADIQAALEVYMALARERLPHLEPRTLPWKLSDTSSLWRSALLLST